MALIIKNTFLFAMSMPLVPKLKVFFTKKFYIYTILGYEVLLMLNDWPPKNKWVWSYFILVRRSATLNVQSKSLNENANVTGTRVCLYFLNIQYTIGQHNRTARARISSPVSGGQWHLNHLTYHPQVVLPAQFSLYVHKGGLKPDSFYPCLASPKYVQETTFFHLIIQGQFLDMIFQTNVPRFCTGSICGWNLGLGSTAIINIYFFQCQDLFIH